MITNNLFRECLSQIPQQVRREFDFIFSVTDKIVSVMEKKGVSVADLAAKLHKSESEISKWLTGRYNFTLKELMKISEVLGEPLIEISKAPLPKVMETQKFLNRIYEEC